MDLDFSDDQQLLRDTVRRICNTAFDSATVRALEQERDKFNRAFWSALSETGLCGLLVPPEQGGAGMGALDLAIVFEEFGNVLASSPFLHSAVTASAIVAQDDAMAGHWLAGIATGEKIVIPLACQGDPQASGNSVTFADGKLSGSASMVPFASVADALLVPVADATWALVMADAAGVSVAAQANHASQPLFRVTFEDVIAPTAHLIGNVRGQNLREAHVLIATAAEAVGAATRLLALTADYANQRRQFDRPIASFQAISHPLAELATELEAARYLTYQAAWAVDEGRPYAHLAEMAKYCATSMFRRLAIASVQIHGGIGYSSDGEPQLYYRRAKHYELMHGTSHTLKRSIADLVLG